jgi:protein-L-isoaspartate(D-aspartate) O-methyltransferase
MNAEYFEEQRREMVAAIRAITEHMAAELGKTALDERVLRAMAKVPRHEFVPVEVVMVTRIRELRKWLRTSCNHLK